MATSVSNNKVETWRNMSNDKKLKILLLGPVSTGKTAVANFLSDSTESLPGETRPTKGVRIVEFVCQGIRAKSIYQKTVEVELWDCSGDNRYQSCWPAIQHKTDGIVFVYSEDSPQQKSALNKLYSVFVEEANFPESCCCVVRHQLSIDEGCKMSESPLPNLSHTVVNLDDKGQEFKKYFNSFLSTILKSNFND